MFQPVSLKRSMSTIFCKSSNSHSELKEGKGQASLLPRDIHILLANSQVAKRYPFLSQLTLSKNSFTVGRPNGFEAPAPKNNAIFGIFGYPPPSLSRPSSALNSSNWLNADPAFVVLESL